MKSERDAASELPVVKVSGPFVVDRLSVSEGADGALGVSSDAKDEPKRGACVSGEPASYDAPATHADGEEKVPDTNGTADGFCRVLCCDI